MVAATMDAPRRPRRYKVSLYAHFFFVEVLSRPLCIGVFGLVCSYVNQPFPFCIPLPAARCGSVYPLRLSPWSPRAVFQLDYFAANGLAGDGKEQNGNNVTLHTCTYTAGANASVPVGLSVYFGPFPLAQAYYNSPISDTTGHAASYQTYNETGALIAPSGRSACGNVTIRTNGGGMPVWVVVGSAVGAYATTGTTTAALSVSCANPMAPSPIPLRRSFFPYANVPAANCSGASGLYSIQPNIIVNGQPLWSQTAGSSTRYLKYSSTLGKWIVTSSRTTDSPVTCSLGRTKDFSSTFPSFGVCPAGSYGHPNTTECVPCPAPLTSNAGSETISDCVGGPSDLRMVASASPLPQSAVACPAGQIPNASSPTLCSACPLGSYVASPRATSCTWRHYNRVNLAFSGLPWKGNWVATSVIRGGAPVYVHDPEVPSKYVLQYSGSSWLLTVCLDCGYVSSMESPFVHGVLSGSWAYCDKEGDSIYDQSGRRVCYCPAGMIADVNGTCTRCPKGSFRADSTTADGACETCIGATTTSDGASACDAPYCTGFYFMSRSGQDSEFTGNYTHLNATTPGTRPVYARSDNAFFLYLRRPPQNEKYAVWVVDNDTDAGNGVRWVQTNGSSFFVPGPSFDIDWLKDGTSSHTVTKAACIQCGGGSFGLPGASATGCSVCPADKSTAWTRVTWPPSDATACVCAAGREGPGCTPCSTTTFKNSPGSGSCVACPTGQISSALDGAACACPVGYALNNVTQLCEDIDECAVNNGGCGGTCTNSAGSYACSCPPSSHGLAPDRKACVPCGFGFSANGTHCTACSSPFHAALPATGSSGGGATSCGCPPGYTTSLQSIAACLPPSGLSLALSPGITASSLRLSRLQVLTVSAPTALGVPSNLTYVTVLSPVYKQQLPAQQGSNKGLPTSPGDVWHYWSWDASSSGSAWALHGWPSLLGVNSSTGPTTFAPPAAAAAGFTISGAYGKASWAQPFPPFSASADISAWLSYRTSAPLAAFAAPVSASLTAVSSASTDGRAFLTSGMDSDIRRGDVYTIVIAGLAAPGDAIAFLPATGGVDCSGSLLDLSSASVLDDAMQAVLTVPLTAPADVKLQLCLSPTSVRSTGSTPSYRPVLQQGTSAPVEVTFTDCATCTPVSTRSSSGTGSATATSTGTAYPTFSATASSTITASQVSNITKCRHSAFGVGRL